VSEESDDRMVSPQLMSPRWLAPGPLPGERFLRLLLAGRRSLIGGHHKPTRQTFMQSKPMLDFRCAKRISSFVRALLDRSNSGVPF
jgi:hypothetical protein